MSELGLCIIEITDEDLEVAGKWIAKVTAVDEEEEDEDGEVFVSRKLVFELIRKLKGDEDLELYFEIAKLPGVNFSGGGMLCGS